MATVQCARPGCVKGSNKTCSACLKESYCGVVCQKLDWKIHKIMCGCMKDRSKLPLKERGDARSEVISELLRHAKLKMEISIENGIRIFKCCLSYVENMYSARIVGQPYPSSITDLLYGICDLLVDSYESLASELNISDYNRKDAWNNVFFYLEKALSILVPWGQVQLDTKDSYQIESLDKEDINEIYVKIVKTEISLSYYHKRFQNSEKGIECCDRSLFYLEKLIEGEEKTELLSSTLLSKSRLLFAVNKFCQAKIVAEENYRLLTDAYDSDHPFVLEAGNQFVSILTANKEYYDAQRFARILYDTLQRSDDPESEAVADALYSLACACHVPDALSVITQEGEGGGGGELAEHDIKFLAKIAKKSLRIKERLYGSNGKSLQNLSLLMNILHRQAYFVGDTGNDEILEGLEKMLVIFMLPESSINPSINDYLIGNTKFKLAVHYCNIANNLPVGDVRAGKLVLAIALCKEAIRINIRIHGPTHTDTIHYKLLLTNIKEMLTDSD